MRPSLTARQNVRANRSRPLALFLSLLLFTAALPQGSVSQTAHAADNNGANASTASGQPGPEATANADSSQTSTLNPSTQARLAEAYGKLSMSFEANQGQFDPQVQYLARGSGYGLFLTSTEAVLVLTKADANKAKGRRAKSPAAFEAKAGKPQRKSKEAEDIKRARDVEAAAPKSAVLRMKLEGANSTPQIEGMDELPGKTNYFIGNDPMKWQTEIPSYARVMYREVYPGVDLVYYGQQQQLEYDFRVAPGVDPGNIKLAFEGAQSIEVDAQGDLVLHTKGGDVRQHKPVVYQEVDGAKREIPSRYEMKDQQRVGFQVEAYDASKPLIIDPVLSYSTFLGGSSSEIGYSVAADAAGNIYVTGRTGSTNFPVVHPVQGDVPLSTEAFVTKLNAAGTAFIYSTYLGGVGLDEGDSIAVDATGNAYVTGLTAAADFPLVNPLQATRNGSNDAFVTKLNPRGSGLVYSTYLGGAGYEQGYGVTVDSAGNAYVAGRTSSVNFPTTNPFQATKGGHQAFKSTNGGGNWNTSDSGLNAAYVNDLAIDPVNPAILYVATDRGVFKSTNNGDTWKATNTGLTIISEVTDVAIDPANPSTVYAGTIAGLFKSTNSGSTWSELDLGFPFPNIYTLVIDPVHTSTIYAGGLLGGVYKSTDGGSTWTGYSLSDYPYYLPVYALAIDPKTPTTLYAGVDYVGVMKSTDGGLNWSYNHTGLPSSTGYALAVDPVNPSNVYLGLTYGGIYKSSNGGSAWKAANLGLITHNEVYALAIDPAHPSTIYAGTNGSSLFKSTNGSNSWSASETGLTNRVIRGIVVDPTTPTTVYTATSSGTDAFITKLDPTGTAALYSTYLGGEESDQGRGIALDGDGNAYVTGATFSTNFPTANPLQATFASPDSGSRDAFVTKLDATGSNLSYSTYLGGNGDEQGNGIAVDSVGNAYVTGFVQQLEVPVSFPLTPGAFQTTFGGSDFTTDAFVTRVNAAGSSLVYSTYLGGSYYDQAHGIAVDSAGQAYVTGYTSSNNFPLANATQDSLAGYFFNYDAFVTRLNASGSSLVFSTYLGGSYDDDEGNGIAVDADKNIYVVGDTYSHNFPTLNALQSQFGGFLDAFITKFGPPLSSIQISGRVTLENGKGVSGVTITLTGNGAPMTTTTGNGGSYSFVNLPGGRNYKITPSKSGYQFTPTSRSYTNLRTNLTAQNFVASPFTVSIYVYANARGVKLTLSGSRTGACTTDYSGSCAFMNLPAGGNYTVTPSAPGATFHPAYKTFTNLNEDQAISFDVAFSINGQVKDVNGLGISGVTVKLSGNRSATATTDSDGKYTFTNLPTDSYYMVTPSKAGMSFSPAAQEFYLSATRKADFLALVSITGKVRRAGTATGISGVTVKLTGSRTATATTGSDGIYMFVNLPAGGDYTVTPSKSGFTFNPSSRTFNNLRMSQSFGTSYFDGMP